jgi:hypothetical protein
MGWGERFELHALEEIGQEARALHLLLPEKPHPAVPVDDPHLVGAGLQVEVSRFSRISAIVLASLITSTQMSGASVVGSPVSLILLRRSSEAQITSACFAGGDCQFLECLTAGEQFV